MNSYKHLISMNLDLFATRRGGEKRIGEEEKMAYANSQMPDKLSLRSIPRQPLITLMDILLQ
jgi:hypothetical protein